MTSKEDILRMAREAHGRTTGEWWDMDVAALERFAALVLASHPPQSSMAWQEGFEAGRLAEREACAKVCEANVWSRDVGWWQSATKSEVSVEASLQCAAAVRARGQA